MPPIRKSPISDKSGNLVKAILKSDDGVPDLEFMFNPTELVFRGSCTNIRKSGCAHPRQRTA